MHHFIPLEHGAEIPSFRRGLALFAVPVFLFGWGCWAALSPREDRSSSPAALGLELIDAERRISPETIGDASEAQCAAITRQIISFSRSSGIDPREELASSFPDAHHVIGMLSRNRDVRDYEDYAARGGRIGDYYGTEADLARKMRLLRSRYEAVYASTYAALVGGDSDALFVLPGARASEPPDYLGGSGRKKPYIAAPDEVWFPARAELRKTHQYALDVFFFHVDSSGGVERGPAIHSLYPGIVVCAAADWAGGQGEEEWRSGGLSPAAGDGVIVYDPGTRRYASYFHLSSLACRTGDVVKAGTILGRGGNTGAHARMKGHGEHVHVEIFDCARDSNLSIYEIYDLLRR
jgi:murein DD-endopeptidase MepM/ murein hydrolase activator NlpD